MIVMDIGVWMSREVLEHKRQDDVAVQAWNLRLLPDGFANTPGVGQMFVAVDGHWRGFFRLAPKIIRNEADPACPYTLVFNPRSWTPILPERAPQRDRRTGFTLAVPTMEISIPKRTRQENETQELCSLLEREEERE